MSAAATGWISPVIVAQIEAVSSAILGYTLRQIEVSHSSLACLAEASERRRACLVEASGRRRVIRRFERRDFVDRSGVGPPQPRPIRFERILARSEHLSNHHRPFF